MEKSNGTQKAITLLEDDGVYDVLVDIIEAECDSYRRKKAMRPKAGSNFFDIAMTDMLDRGAVCALQALKGRIDGLRAEAIDKFPSNQTQ